jgi:hypothetical protein
MSRFKNLFIVLKYVFKALVTRCPKYVEEVYFINCDSENGRETNILVCTHLLHKI